VGGGLGINEYLKCSKMMRGMQGIVAADHQIGIPDEADR